MTRALLPLILVTSLFAAAPSWAQELVPDSVLWAGTAVEHDGATLQAFGLARSMLDEALRNRTWTAAIEQQGKLIRSLPPAVIMDVDETILDNSPFEARRAMGGGQYDENQWRAWVNEGRAAALPGAVEFTRYAHARGVTIFYVTNRAAAFKEVTRSNLRKDGFPFESAVDTLYCQGEKPDWGPDKTTRRAEIARKFRILLLFGDDLNDFISDASDSVARRRELVEPYSDRWGKQWIVLPNPMYGSWEAALYRSISNPTEEQKRELKYQSLKELTKGRSTDPGGEGQTR